MPAVAIVAPIYAIPSMTSGARTTRRRSRGDTFFDDDGGDRVIGGPVTKKRREDKKAPARTTQTQPKKPPRVYEENDDDFFFTRKPAKPKTRMKPPPSSPPPVVAGAEVPTAPVTKSRLPTEYSLQSAASLDLPAQKRPKITTADATTRRTSGRLKKKAASPPVSSPPLVAKPTEKPYSRHHKHPRYDNNDDIQGTEDTTALSARAPSPTRNARASCDRDRVRGKDRDLDRPKSPTAPAKIAIPMADTPMIRRNQQFRQQAGNSSARRSSFGLRGRRASSLLDQGVAAEPHHEIAPEDYYKHIHAEIVEPRRMMQLLVWCSKKAMETSEAKPQRPGEGNSHAVARLIKEEIQKELLERGEFSNWFKRDGTLDSPVVKKPNPKNIEMLEQVERLEASLEKIKLERKSWESILSNTSAPAELALDTPPTLPIPATISTSSPATIGPDNPTSTSQAQSTNTHLNTEETVFATTALPTLEFTANRIKERIKSQLSCSADSDAGIELTVDTLDDGLHHISEFEKLANCLGQEVLREAEDFLGRKERELKRKAGTEGLGLQEVLRSLSRMGGVAGSHGQGQVEGV